MRRGLLAKLSQWLRPGRKRPNVVWICVDDYNPSVSGTYGSALARTPNLDRLAGQGLRFDRAFCNCPLSTPSRMAFLTGRYPRSVGVTLSPTGLPEGEVTIGRLLGDSGYETVAFGKTHYYNPLVSEFDRCVDLREHHAHLATRDRKPLPPGVEVLGHWAPFDDPASVWLNAEGLPYAFDAEMPDTFFTEQAAGFLAGRRRKPFFLSLGFYVTHSPFRFPIEFRGRFDPAVFPVPEVGEEDQGRIPPVFRDLTDSDKRGIIAAYHTSAAYMDRNLGTILRALDRSGLAENTLVIFHSDHGYLLGEHGRFEKHCCYEEAVRSALVVRLPGVVEPGRSTSAMVELIDVVPTVLELCGVEIPLNVQGRSMVPILRAASGSHREHVISEYADNAEAMVRTDRWKLIHSAGNRRRGDGYAIGRFPPGPSTRLYDLADDPSEMKDVAGLEVNREVVDRLLDILARHLKATARDPTRIPDSAELQVIFEYGLPPGDSRFGKPW